jgi:hypothetical protein
VINGKTFVMTAFFLLAIVIAFQWEARTVLFKTRYIGRVKSATKEKKETSIITLLKMDGYQKYAELAEELSLMKKQISTLREELKKIKSTLSSQKKIFKKPIQEDVIKYFLENGYTANSAKEAYKYYDDNDWFDSRGNKVKNWKGKMRSVWFREENKRQDQKKRTYY